MAGSCVRVAVGVLAAVLLACGGALAEAGGFPSKAYACQPPHDTAQPFCDTSKTAAERVALLVGNLSVAELVATVLKQPIERLGVPGYNMWATESLHGVRLWPEKCPFPDKCTTIFPTAGTSSRSFNRSTWRAIGAAMGLEGRALFNLGIIPALSLRGPQLNIQRDPRWGRNSNSPSEDPYLTGDYGVELIQGMQGLGPTRLVAAEMKHFTAYSVENNRFGFNANISVRDLSDTYFPPMRMAHQQGNVSAVMCSYAAINGTPSCANAWMNGQVLRDSWGFEGVMESDGGALTNIYTHHHYTADAVHAAAAAMEATCDVELDSVFEHNLANALSAGLLNVSFVRAAATRIYMHRFRLGLFDAITGQPYAAGKYASADSVHSDAHAALALEAAQQSVVLVQNGAALPWSIAHGETVAIVGANVNVSDAFLGDYRPAACPGKPMKAPEGTDRCKKTAWQVLQQWVKASGATPKLAVGCVDGPPCTSLDLATFNATLAAADRIIMVMGEKTTDNDDKGNTCSEGHDRATVAAPGQQNALLDVALSYGKPMAVVVLSGGAVALDAAAGHPKTSVLYAGFGGESGPEAILSVLEGSFNPSARLPFTVYPRAWEDGVEMNSMAMANRTYRYLDASVAPLFPFGSGQSYTSFTIKGVDANASAVCVEVAQAATNTAPPAPAAIVLMAFFTPPAASALEPPPGYALPAVLPRAQLFDHTKLWLGASTAQRVCFGVEPDQLALVDDHGNRLVYAGAYQITVAFDTADSGAQAAFGVKVPAPAVVEVLPQP